MTREVAQGVLRLPDGRFLLLRVQYVDFPYLVAQAQEVAWDHGEDISALTLDSIATSCYHLTGW